MDEGGEKREEVKGKRSEKRRREGSAGKKR